jgi:L-threonylcarbamoyladenylate synthase
MDAVEEIFRIKGRDDRQPLPVLFATRFDLEGLGVTADPGTLDVYFSIWPAPLTVVLPVRTPLAVSRGVSTLGVRLPASRSLRSLLSVVGPVTGTSANRSGSPPLSDPDEVEAVFRREITLLVDGGKTPGGLPSTLLDATRDPPVVLRHGAHLWPG